jgi:hypothetical protein
MITEEQFLAWLGSDATLQDLVDLVVELVNEDYPLNILQSDIEGYEV